MTPDAQTSADCLEALQLPPGSSAQQIHAQYRRLAKQYHPDRNPHRREWSEERLRRLNAAYHALAEAGAAQAPFASSAGAAQAPAAAPSPPASWPQSAPAVPEQPLRGRAARRVLRSLAVVGLVCGASVAYSNWQQPPPMPLAPDSGAAFSLSPPAAPAGPLVPSPAAPALPPVRAKPAALAAKFAEEGIKVDASVARAKRIVGHVDAELQHAPQSRRPQRAEQLAADALELSRLQQSIRSGLEDLRAPNSSDLRRIQAAYLQLALFQLKRQQHLVNAETASFPAK